MPEDVSFSSLSNLLSKFIDTQGHQKIETAADLKQG